METTGWSSAVQDWNMFLPYLWGMETGNIGDKDYRHDTFLPYLWGMETLLPDYIILQNIGSYRTYEEWKPAMPSISLTRRFPFLPYLWGMETLTVWHNSQPELTVLTVPMRNGNTQAELSVLRYQLVLTVPMRNGNDEFYEHATKEDKFLPYLWGMETSKHK